MKKKQKNTYLCFGQQQKFGTKQLVWTEIMPNSSRWNLLCVTVSHSLIVFFFNLFILCQTVPCERVSFKALRQGSTASNPTEDTNLLSPPNLLLYVSIFQNFLQEPRWVWLIFFHFVEVRQEEHLWDSPFEKKKKKKKSPFCFVILHFLCPSSPLLF